MNKKFLVSFMIVAAVSAAIFFWLRPIETSPTDTPERTEEEVVIKTENSEVQVTQAPQVEATIVAQEIPEAKTDLGKYCQTEPQAFIKQRLDNLMQEYGDGLQDQLETYNIEFINDGKPYRIQMSMDEDTQGRPLQQINFFSVDKENLPVREDLPLQYQDRPWEDVLDQIQRQYKINWREEQHLMVTPNGEIIRAIIRNGEITAFEDKKVICRNGSCNCENL